MDQKILMIILFVLVIALAVCSTVVVYNIRQISDPEPVVTTNYSSGKVSINVVNPENETIQEQPVNNNSDE